MIGFGTMTRRAGGWLPVVAVTGIVGTATMLALPAALGRAVDAVVTGADSGRWLAVVAGLVFAGMACELLAGYADTACTARATSWLRDSLTRHMLSVGPVPLRRFGTGDLVARVSGVAASAGSAGPSVVQAVLSAVPPLGAFVLLVVIDLATAGAFLAGLALVALVLRAFTRRTADVVGSYQVRQGGIAARLAESLAGARTIAAAGTVELERRRVLADLPGLHADGVRTWQVLARTGAQSAVVGPLVLLAVLAVGGFAVLDGRITAGDLFAASRYAVIGAGLGGLTGVFGRLARTRAALARTGEMFAIPQPGYGGTPLPDGPGRLEFRRVSVHAGDRLLLSDVDLVVPGGAAVAVVGASGAGKSVLAELAARLRDPDTGTVLLDGVPLAALGHDELRAAVGCAFDRPVLVGATVAEAIAPHADAERVRAAARATYAHEFISRLPEGYRTPLQDAPMSGGETQRIGLARAWPARKLLVLDDATSSLDTVTELRISRTLLATGAGRTRLIVTHRMATAARADLVVWLDGGRVRAVGRHDDLCADPAYRQVFG